MTEAPGGLDKKASVGIIGAGRMGSSLAVALADAGYAVTAVSTRRREHADWLRSRLPGVLVTDSAQDVADAARIVFITTSDSAIHEVAVGVSWRAGQAVLHCSGAAPIAELDPAASSGALTGGLHPMQTFPSRDASGSFNGITFGLEAHDPALNSWLRTVADSLGGRVIEITSGQRASYHAAAVMACGLLAGLSGLAAEMWAESGISRADALAGLSPLIESTARWIGENGLPGAMTGPFVRGDLQTIETHLSATASHSAETGAAYAALALASLHIAREQGGLTGEAEADIKSALAASLARTCEIINRS